MSRPTCMTIDLAALKHNLERVYALTQSRPVIAMVKANAYGHGIARVAHALSNVESLGVASLEEGIMLREAGIMQPIVLMEGLFNKEELLEAAKYHFTLVVHHFPHVEMLKTCKMEAAFTVWLKINTGMHRLGFDPQVLPEVYQELQQLSCVKKPLRLMTHFAKADDVNDAATLQQMALFRELTKKFPGPKSLANSAAILAWPDAHADWVRPGLILYGASPIAGKTGIDYHLQPVMTLWSRIIAIIPVKKGASVGYGGTWTAPQDTYVGVVGVGYGDGYPQFAKNGTPVLINYTEYPLVGRVSMDMLTVDVGPIVSVQVGDPVVLWGKGLPVERVAAFSNTSPYEILTRMTPRPKIEVRHYE